MVYDPLADYSDYSNTIANKPTALGSATDAMQSGMYSGLEFAAREAGFDSISDWSKAKAAQNLAESQRYIPTGPQRVEDIGKTGNYGSDTLDYIGNMAISQAPILGTMLGAGAAGALVAGPMGALAGAVSATAPMHLGEAYNRQKGEGIDDPAKVWGAAGINTALDVIPVGTFINTARRLGGGTFAKAVARGAAAEGATEATQGVVVDYAADIMPSLEHDYVMDRVNEAVAGAMLGGGMTGGAHAVGSVAGLPGAAYDTVRDADFDPMQGIKNAVGYQEAERSPFQPREEVTGDSPFLQDTKQKNKAGQSADLEITAIRNQFAREGFIYPDQEQWLINNYSPEEIDIILDIEEGREDFTPEVDVDVTQEDGLEEYQNMQKGSRMADAYEEDQVYDEAVAQEEADPYLDTEANELQFKEYVDEESSDSEQPDARIEDDVSFTKKNMRIGKLDTKGKKWDGEKDYLLSTERALPYRGKTRKRDFKTAQDYMDKLNTSKKRSYKVTTLSEGIEADIRKEFGRYGMGDPNPDQLNTKQASFTDDNVDEFGYALQEDVSPEAISIDKRIANRKAEVAADIMASRKEAIADAKAKKLGTPVEQHSDLYTELVRRYDDGKNPEAVLELYDAIESTNISDSTRGAAGFDFQDKEYIEVSYKKDDKNPKADTTKVSQGFVPLVPENKGDPYRQLDMVKAVKLRIKDIKYDNDFKGLNQKELTAEAAKSVLAEYLPRVDFTNKAISAQRQARTATHPKLNESVKLQQVNKIISRIVEEKSSIEILPGKDKDNNDVDINVIKELNKTRGDSTLVAKNILNKVNLATIFRNQKYKSLIGDTDSEVSRILENYKMENLLAEIGISAKFLYSKFGKTYDVTPAAEGLSLTAEEKNKAKKERYNIQLAELDKQLKSKINKKISKSKVRDPAWFKDWEEKDDKTGGTIRTRLIPDHVYKDSTLLAKWKEDLKDNPELEQELADRETWEQKSGARKANDDAIKRIQAQIDKKAKQELGDGAEFDAFVAKLYAREEALKQEKGEGQFDYREDLEQIAGSEGQEGKGASINLEDQTEIQAITNEDLSLQEQQTVAKAFPLSTNKNINKIEKEGAVKPTVLPIAPIIKSKEYEKIELYKLLENIYINGKYKLAKDLTKEQKELLASYSPKEIQAAKKLLNENRGGIKSEPKSEYANFTDKQLGEETRTLTELIRKEKDQTKKLELIAKQKDINVRRIELRKESKAKRIKPTPWKKAPDPKSTQKGTQKPKVKYKTKYLEPKETSKKDVDYYEDIKIPTKEDFRTLSEVKIDAWKELKYEEKDLNAGIEKYKDDAVVSKSIQRRLTVVRKQLDDFVNKNKETKQKVDKKEVDKKEVPKPDDFDAFMDNIPVQETIQEAKPTKSLQELRAERDALTKQMTLHSKDPAIFETLRKKLNAKRTEIKNFSTKKVGLSALSPNAKEYINTLTTLKEIERAAKVYKTRGNTDAIELLRAKYKEIRAKGETKSETKIDTENKQEVIKPLVINKDYRPAQQYGMQLYNEYINKSEKAILVKHKQLYTKSMNHDYGNNGENVNFADADLTMLRSLMKKRNIPMPKDQQDDFTRSTLSDLQIDFNQVDGLIRELEFEISSREIKESTDKDYEEWWMITPAKVKSLETKIIKLKKERASIENKLKAIETETKPETVATEEKGKIDKLIETKEQYPDGIPLELQGKESSTGNRVPHGYQVDGKPGWKLRNDVARVKYIRDLMPTGERTATTRSMKAMYPVGSEFTTPGVEGVYKVIRIQKAGRDAEAWSKLEGWAPEAMDKFGYQVTPKSWQMVFERIDKPVKPTKSETKPETKPKPKPKTKPETKAKQKEETDKIPFDDAEYAKQKADHKAGLSKSFTQKFGKVSKTEVTVAQTQALADKYLKDLGINAKIVDGKDALKIANELGIDDAEVGMMVGSLHGFASSVPNADGSYNVYINPAIQGQLRNEILEHELGHIIMYGSELDPSSSEASAVLSEFTGWLDKQGKDSNLVTDLIKSKKSPEAALLYMQQMGSGLKMKDLPQNMKDYMLDFDEWFADQAGKALARNTAPRTAVQKFFARLVKALKKVFGTDDKVETYIDRLRNKHTTNVNGELTPQLAGLSASFEEDIHKDDIWGKTKDVLQNVFADKDYNMRRLAGGNVDAFNDLADLMFKPRGDIKSDNSYWHNKLLYLAKYDTRATDIMRGATREVQAKVMKQLYNENLSDHFALDRTVKIRNLLRDLKTYMEDEGIKVPTRKNYFPNIVDPEYTAEHHDDFIEMMKKYPDAMEGIMEKWNKDVKIRDKYLQQITDPSDLVTEADIPQLLYENIVRGDLMDEAVSEGQQTPHIRFLKHRVIDFLQGQDKVIWKDSYLQHSVTDATSTYIMQVVKRVEYNKRFGKLDANEKKQYVQKKKRDGGKINYTDYEIKDFENESNWTNRLEVLLDRAKDEGATNSEIQRARDYVAAEMGTHGRDTAKWLNEKFGIPMPQSHAPINTDIQKGTSALMSLANVWVLGLSTITSLLDPIGIAVRSGSMTQSLSSMAVGIKAAIGKDRTELEIIAEAVGSISDIATKEALAHGYNMVNMTPGIKKMNDKFFHLIGLEQWTKTTRLMAVDAAQGFIKRHDQKPNANSERFLKELGLKEGDIKYGVNGKVKVLTYEQHQKASDLEQARNNRVKSAIAEFVDTSILRPSPSQRPAWASDPHFALLFHLKSFMYSFQKTILNPMWKEAKEHGNYAPLLAVSMYIPAGIAIGLIKDLFKTFGDDEDDWTPDYKENWGLGDYMLDGVEKSGLTGISQPIFDIMRSQKYGGTWVGGLFGPALEPWDTFNGLPVPLNYTWNNLTK